MRLIKAKKLVDDDTVSFEVFTGSNIPPYVVLSHTWEKGQEVSYANSKSKTSKTKKGYKKIKKTCEFARKQRPPIEYVWVDTCCIDKSSSAELTEAINSMFKWYEQAKCCFVYLCDLDKPQGPRVVDSLALGKCRWFHRGWTLQELIAPAAVYFYSRTWDLIGSKQQLSSQISAVTGIETEVLDQRVPLSAILVAKRMSWAANRKTTREEDIAYCLLGIFDINIPIIYGEGHKAFKRLQEELIRSTYDLSIFAWTPVEDDRKSMYCGFLANSPDAFALCSNLVPVDMFWEVRGELVATSTSLQLKAPNYEMKYNGKHQYFLRLNCCYPADEKDEKCLAVPMRKIYSQTYLRARILPLSTESTTFGLMSCPLDEIGPQTLVLLTNLPQSLGYRSLTMGQSQDITALTRFAAVQFDSHPEFPSWDGQSLEGFPRKSWDVQDHLFFSPRGSASNWGAVSLGEMGITSAIFFCYWYKQSAGWDCKGTLIGLNDNYNWMDVWRELFITAQEFDYRADYVLHQLSHYQVDMEKRTTSIRRQGGTANVFFTIQKSNGRGICNEHFWKVTIGIR
jgi:hypothetical protein